MPCDYSKYPPNWKSEIRPRILKRANNCCEFCGVQNGDHVFRMRKGQDEIFLSLDKHRAYHYPIGWEVDFDGPLFWHIMNSQNLTKIVLTIAHLDHDEHNHDVQDDRLAALCQCCHIRFDSKEKARRRKQKKYKKEHKDQISLFASQL